MKKFRDACDGVAGDRIQDADIPQDLRRITFLLKMQRHANYPPPYRGPLLDGEEEMDQLMSARLAATLSLNEMP